MEAVQEALRIARAPKASPRVHSGAIRSDVPGRTDHLPMHLPSGAYVIPADVVSHHGEGNTLAGFKALDTLFDSFDRTGGKPYGEAGLPYGAREQRARGGSAEVPIVGAGGEYVVHPHIIESIGRHFGGDLNDGHSILDQFVLQSRADHVKTLKKLPGPRKN
jgi:hypothetical protein